MLQIKVVEAYLVLSVAIFLIFSLYMARMETEYCKVVGITISFERVYWSQVNCRKRYDDKNL